LAAIKWLQKKRLNGQALTTEPNSADPLPFLLHLFQDIERLSEMEARLGPGLSASGRALERSQSTDGLFLLKRAIGKGYAPVQERWDAGLLGRKADGLAEEGRHQECYNVLKLSICGTGESEYSAAYTRFVEGRIEAFCQLKRIDPDAVESFRRDFRMIFKLAVGYPDAFIGYELSRVADAERDIVKAVRLRKEVIFWHGVALFDVPKWDGEREIIDGQISELCRTLREGGFNDPDDVFVVTTPPAWKVRSPRISGGGPNLPGVQ
jgi:hypothetical protein